MIFAKWVLILLALSLLMRFRLNVSLLALVMFYADKLRRIEKKNLKHTTIDHAKKKHFRGGIRKSNEIFGKNKASCLKTFV